MIFVRVRDDGSVFRAVFACGAVVVSVMRARVDAPHRRVPRSFNNADERPDDDAALCVPRPGDWSFDRPRPTAFGNAKRWKGAP